jgi:Fungal Zn(2)-Cys(6) binuclear cluster domain
MSNRQNNESKHALGSYGKSLRSSCRYCRRRKIKCDSNNPCGTCTTRKIDCVHDQKSQMGRPRKNEEGYFLSDIKQETQTCIDLGSILDTAFQDTFGGKVPSTAFSAAVQGYVREYGESLIIDASARAQQKICTPEVYEVLYPMIFKDVLDGCRWHFSSMDLNKQARRPAYFPVGLQCDTSESMIPLYPSQKKFPEVEEGDLRYLYKIWSQVHPLSSGIPFSCLQEEQGKALRHLIICEARQLEGEYPESEIHFAYASNLYRQIQIPVFDNETQLARTASTLISACQAALLFGWREFSSARSKRGAAYMAASGQLFGRLQNLSNRIEMKVEQLTIIKSLSSTFSLMTLWAFSQLDRSTGNLGIGWLGFDVNAAQSAEVIVTDVVARLCSTLLNNHPSILSSTHGPANELSGVNVSQYTQAVAIQLYDHIVSAKLAENVELTDESLERTKQLLEGIRWCICLILLSPGEDGFLPLPTIGQELLRVCRSACESVIELCGLTQYRNDDVLFTNVTFSRQAKSRKSDKQEPLRKTIGAYLYDLLSHNSTRICNCLESPLMRMEFITQMDEWLSLFRSLSEASLDLLDTSSLTNARAIITKSVEKMSSQCYSISESTPELSSSTSSSITTPKNTNFQPDFALDAESILEQISFDFNQINDIQQESLNEITVPKPIMEDENLLNILWGYIPVDFGEN